MVKFKLLGVMISIDFLFIAVITLFSVLDKTGFSLMGIAVCLMHEMGHIIAFYIIGEKPDELVFEMSGIRLSKSFGNISHSKEFFVLISGSLVNFICFFALCGNLHKGINNINIFAVFHLLIGVFNLIPARCFDGGKLTELFLTLFLSQGMSYKISLILDFLSVVLMLVLSVYFTASAKNSLTLIIMTGYLIFSSVLKVVKYKKV